MNTKTKVSGIIVHCSDSPQGRGDTIIEIDRWHKERGFDKVGYHFVILEDGTIQEGRDINVLGAHCKGHNDMIGICLIGIDEFTVPQYKALETLISRFDTEIVTGHYTYSSKTCPNFDVEEFIKTISEDAIEG
jgi:N-acetylmuramoyl-L-alanine amidase